MPPFNSYRPLTAKQRWTVFLVPLLMLLTGLFGCSASKAKQQNAEQKPAATALAPDETLTIQRVTLDLTSACRVSAGVSQGKGRILVKFYGRDTLYVFDVEDRWLLAQREDTVLLKTIGQDAAGRPIYKAEIEYVR